MVRTMMSIGPSGVSGLMLSFMEGYLIGILTKDGARIARGCLCHDWQLT